MAVPALTSTPRPQQAEDNMERVSRGLGGLGAGQQLGLAGRTGAGTRASPPARQRPHTTSKPWPRARRAHPPDTGGQPSIQRAGPGGSCAGAGRHSARPRVVAGLSEGKNPETAA